MRENCELLSPKKVLEKSGITYNAEFLSGLQKKKKKKMIK
jgi:hypothetical protein